MDFEERRSKMPAGRRRKQKEPELWQGIKIGICIAVLLAVAVFCVSKIRFPEEKADGNVTANSSMVPAESAVSAVSTEPTPVPTPTPIPPQLDDPLLVLVNADIPIPEDWVVTPQLIGEQEVDLRIYDDLSAMVADAADDDVWLWVASGYRSVEDQERVFEQGVQRRMDEYGMTEEEAREDALRTINPPRYSEHHTGLCVDINEVNDDFENTYEYLWLKDHAAEYGFVQRYKTSKVDITGIDNESWHYRYVGKEHARRMEELDMCLEEYVDYVRGS